MRPPSVEQLAMLRAVVDTGSFAGAGRRLGYSASAISQQMAALERSSGLDLFERHGPSLRFTPHAQAVLDIIRPVFTAHQELARYAAAQDHGSIPPLKVGAFASAAGHLLVPAIAELLGRESPVPVVLVMDEPHALVAALEAGELDAALTFEYPCLPRPTSSGLVKVQLIRERLFVIGHGRDPRAKLAMTSLRAFKDSTWITTAVDSGGARTLALLCAREGFSPRVVQRTNDYDVVQSLVRSGLGAALVPELALRNDSALFARPVESEGAYRDTYLMSNDDAGPEVLTVTRAIAEAALTWSTRAASAAP